MPNIVCPCSLKVKMPTGICNFPEASISFLHLPHFLRSPLLLSNEGITYYIINYAKKVEGQCYSPDIGTSSKNLIIFKIKFMMKKSHNQCSRLYFQYTDGRSLESKPPGLDIIIMNYPMTIWDFKFPVQIEADDSKRSKNGKYSSKQD